MLNSQLELLSRAEQAEIREKLFKVNKDIIKNPHRYKEIKDEPLLPDDLYTWVGTGITEPWYVIVDYSAYKDVAILEQYRKKGKLKAIRKMKETTRTFNYEINGQRVKIHLAKPIENEIINVSVEVIHPQSKRLKKIDFNVNEGVAELLCEIVEGIYDY